MEQANICGKFQDNSVLLWNEVHLSHNSLPLVSYIYIYIYIYASVNLLALVQLMACRLFGAKLLRGPKLTYYTLAQRSCWGGILISLRPFVCPSIYPSVPSVRPSARPASRVRYVAPTVLVGSISYLYILSNNFRRCVARKVGCNISKFDFLAIFENL